MTSSNLYALALMLATPRRASRRNITSALPAPILQSKEHNPLCRACEQGGIAQLAASPVCLHLPKALRPFFRHDRRLFAAVSRLTYRIIDEFYAEATGRPLRTAMVIAHQTFGDMLRWNPHFHAIVLEGGFDDEGTFFLSRSRGSSRWFDEA